MIKGERLFMFQYSVDSSQKFMDNGKDSLFRGKSFNSSPFKVFPEVWIVYSYIEIYKPHDPSEFSTAYFRNFTIGP